MATEVQSLPVRALPKLVVEEGAVRVYLSRRNLDTLINKLDANLEHPGTSAVTLVKLDVDHPTHPQTHPVIYVTGVEDEEYYLEREPGNVLVFPVRPQGRPN